MQRVLRIQAEGGHQLAPKSAIGVFNNKHPEPYLIAVVGDIQKSLPVAHEAKLKEFQWENAIEEFELKDPLPKEIFLHVKDHADDRYIGGMKISLEDIVKAKNIVKQSYELLYSDEKKMEKKKSRGFVVLSFQVTEKVTKATTNSENTLPNAMQNGKPSPDVGKKNEPAPPTLPSTSAAQPANKFKSKEAATEAKKTPTTENIQQSALNQSNANPTKGNDNPAMHHYLRVQAVGGKNLASKSGFSKTLDQNPDPFITVVVGSQSVDYPELDDVKTKEFEWGNNAIREFDLSAQSKMPTEMIIHAKDKDLIGYWYIGGCKIPLQDVYSKQEIIKQAYTLEYADEEMTKKEHRGEIILSISYFEKEFKTATAKSVDGNQEKNLPEKGKKKAQPSGQAKAEPVSAPVNTAAPLAPVKAEPLASLQTDAAPQALLQTEAAKASTKGGLLAPVITTANTPKPDNQSNERNNPIPIKPNDKPSMHRYVLVQAIGGRNLASKSGVSKFVDRNPDPYVTVVVGSQSKDYSRLNNVKTKEFEWGNDAIHEFDLSEQATIPNEIIVHLKDKDLRGSSYIGGCKIPLHDVITKREILKQAFTLEYANEELTEKGKRGEIILSLQYYEREITTASLNTANPGLSKLASFASKEKGYQNNQQAEGGKSLLEFAAAQNRQSVSSPSSALASFAAGQNNGGNNTTTNNNNGKMSALAEFSASSASDRKRSSINLLQEVDSNAIFQGLLIVHMQSAKDLVIAKRNMFSLNKLADPFVVLSLNHNEGCSLPPHTDGHANPVWESAEHIFTIDTHLPLVLEIVINDKRNVFLAACVIDLKDTILKNPAKVIDYSLPLNLDHQFHPLPGSTVTYGTVQFTLCFQPRAIDKHTHWRPSASRRFQISNVSINLATSNADKLILDDQDLYIDIQYLPMQCSTKGHYAVQTKPIKNVITKSNTKDNIVQWDDVLQLQYAVLPDLERTFCPYLSIAIREKNAIVKEANIAQEYVNVLDIQEGKNEVKLPSRNKRIPCNLALQFVVLCTTIPSSLEKSIVEASGVLHVYVLGANDLNTKLSLQKSCIQLSSKIKAWGGTVYETEPSHSVDHSVLLWNSVFSIPFKALKLESIPTCDMKIELMQKKTSMGSIEIDIVKLLETNQCHVFPLDVAHKDATKCARVFIAMDYKEQVEIDTTIVPSAASNTEQIPAGYLRLVILKAANLLPEQNIEELDPEVRVAIVPRGLTNKKKSMLKTKPIENAGTQPEWNEYLTLEYVPSTETVEPPMLKVSLVDVQMPGESTKASIIGAGEIPLSAFVKTSVSTTIEPLTTSIKLTRNKTISTGVLYVRGIFEPIGGDEEIRLRCREVGKLLRKGDLSGTNGDVHVVHTPGQIELHIGMVKNVSYQVQDKFCIYTWLHSLIEQRLDIPSDVLDVKNVKEGVIMWDKQCTLCTKSGETEILRIDITKGKGLFASLKLPLSKYYQNQSKVFKEWHDLTVQSPITPVNGADQCQILLDVTFHPDLDFQNELLAPNFIGNCAGTLSIYCTELEIQHKPLQNTELSARFSIVYMEPDAHSNQHSSQLPHKVADPPLQKTTSKELHTINYEAVLRLAIPLNSTLFTISKGYCPLLRYELLNESNNVLTRNDISMQSILCHPNMKIVKRLDMSTIATDPQCLATIACQFMFQVADNKVMTEEAAVSAGGAYRNTANPAELTTIDTFSKMSTSSLLSEPGTFSFRILAGRNLDDIDANGEQDPYVIVHKLPTKENFQTAVHFDGGRHPRWDSPIYSVQVQDVHTEYLRLLCLDSGQDDNSADTVLGDTELSIFALLLATQQNANYSKENVNEIGKSKIESCTNWCNGWFPIYLKNGARECCGELRMEYRFVKELDMCILSDQVDSKYINSKGSKGALFIQVHQALNLPCTIGMIPAIQFVLEQSNFQQQTIGERKRITNPVWERAQFQTPVEWCPSIEKSVLLKLNLIDLGAGISNSSNAPVLTSCFINIAPYVIHPYQIHHGWYKFNTSATRSDQIIAMVNVSLQFLPYNVTHNLQPFEVPERYKAELHPGQLHVKVVEGIMLHNTITDPLVTVQTIDQQHALRQNPVKESMSTDTVKQTKPSTSSNNTGSENKLRFSWDESLLFEYNSDGKCSDSTGSDDESTPEGSCNTTSKVMGPSVELQLVSKQTETVGDITIPVFPFIYALANLSSAWYPLYNKRQQLIAQIKLEMQYLSIKSDSQHTDDSHLYVEVSETRGMECKNNECQDVFVKLECFNQTVQTKSQVHDNSNPTWNEVFKFALNVSKLDPLPSLTLSIYNDATVNAKAALIGACNIIVPKEVLFQSKTKELMLEITNKFSGLQKTTTANSATNSNNAGSSTANSLGRLHVRLKRGNFADKAISTSSCLNQAGLVYIIAKSPNQASNPCMELQYSPCFALKSDKIKCFQGDTINTDRTVSIDSIGVVTVEGDSVQLKRDLPNQNTNLIIKLFSTPQNATLCLLGYVLIQNAELKTAYSWPYRLFRDNRTICPPVEASTTKGEEGKSKKQRTKVVENNAMESGQRLPFYDFDISFAYVPFVSGQIVLTVDKVLSSTTIAEYNNSYFLEFRIVKNHTGFVKSAVIKMKEQVSNTLNWSTQTSTRTNRSNAKELQLAYTNGNETTEPQIQVVLYAQNGANSKRKVAHGVFSIVKYAVHPNECFPKECFRLTMLNTNANNNSSNSTTGSSANNTENCILNLDVGFQPKTANDMENKSENSYLQLAESTSNLKKIYLELGGDESTPLSIELLEKHIMNHDKCTVLLEQAAEKVGGMKRLFELMDKNLDGYISYQEYMLYMQQIYKLANQRTESPSNNTVLDVDNSSDNDSDHDIANKSRIIMPKVEDHSDIFNNHTNRRTVTQQGGEISKEDITRHDTDVIDMPSTIATPVIKGPNLKQIHKWRVCDVSKWLTTDMELPQYVPQFENSSIDGPLLLTLTEADVAQVLKIEHPLHQRKLVHKLQDIQSHYSLPPPEEETTSRVEDGGNSSNSKSNKSKHQGTPSSPSKQASPQLLAEEKLTTLGIHKVERSKLNYKLQQDMQLKKAKKKQQEKTQDHWKFEYTNRKKNPKSENENSAVTNLLHGSNDAKYKQAMENVFDHSYMNTSITEDRTTGSQGGNQRTEQRTVQVPLISNTDEVVAIIKQAIWSKADTLVQKNHLQSEQNRIENSDFGDDPDDVSDVISDFNADTSTNANGKGISSAGLKLVFDTFLNLKNNGASYLGHVSKVSRLKFQGGIYSLLHIDLSWHQFDLMFRRIDRDNSNELSFSEFEQAFATETFNGQKNMNHDIFMIKEALVSVVERLEQHQLTLTKAWQAFDRDGSGTVSVAEFSTLIRFLTHTEIGTNLNKHQVYLMMACLDTSCDRQIQHSEFLKFFFIVWSYRLMQVQQYLNEYQNDPNMEKETCIMKNKKVALRKALRMNFSRPFRDSMRCNNVVLPGPFESLIKKLGLSSISDNNSNSNATQSNMQRGESDPSTVQVWEVLKGMKRAKTNNVAMDSGDGTKPTQHRKLKSGRNEVSRTQLISRSRHSERSNAVLATPPQVDLNKQRLTYDRKTKQY